MHAVSHSCSWPLAGCAGDGGWDSSRDSSGDSLGTACRLYSSRDRLQCLCADLATQAWCQVTERARSSELLFLSLCVVFLVPSLQRMSPSSSNVPESCRSGSSMREVTRPCCHLAECPSSPCAVERACHPPGHGAVGRGQPRWSRCQPSRLPGLRDQSGLINASGRINHGQNCAPGKALRSSVFTGLMPNSELCHLSEQFVLKEGRRSCFLEGGGWL